MPRKPKHTLTDLIAALEYLNDDTPYISNKAPNTWVVADNSIARQAARWCVEWHIKQRAASKGNPGRPKQTCICGHYLSEHVQGACLYCPCNYGNG